MTTKRKIESQPKLKLYYFNIKGKGEPIRLFCAYAGLELDDHRFASRDEFTALKESGKIAFGQVPMLEIDDGKHQLVQTASILRYLAKISNVGYPLDDPIMAAKVDAALDQENDSFTGMTVATYTTRFGIPLDDEMKTKSYRGIDADSYSISPSIAWEFHEFTPRPVHHTADVIPGSTERRYKRRRIFFR